MLGKQIGSQPQASLHRFVACSVNGTWTVCGKGLQVFRCTVAFMAVKAVLWVNLMEGIHYAVSGYLSQD